MHALMDQPPRTRSTSFRVPLRTSLKLLTILVLFVTVPVAVYVTVSSKDSAVVARPADRITVLAAGRGKPFMNLQDGRRMSIEYRGDQPATAALQNGSAQSRALASADFDRNGTPDVVAGYAANGAGLIAVQPGNLEAFAPVDDSVFVRMQQGYDPPSLLPTADVYAVPVSPDFVVTGNFNQDGGKDVLFAAKGGELYLMAGDGTGKLGEPELIGLPGVVTALTAGEFRAADGLTDVAVGVSGPGGESLMIFDAVEGLSSVLAQYRLSAPASAIELGGLDDDPFMDVAVASGSEVVVIHGWGRKEKVSAELRDERIDVGSSVRGLALGEFEWDRAGHTEIAALTDDGTIHIIQNAKLDSRPFTAAEAAERTRGKFIALGTRLQDVESVQSWRPGKSAQWAKGSEFFAASLSSGSPAFGNPLLRTTLSNREVQDLMVLDQVQTKLKIVRPFVQSERYLAENPTGDQSVTTSLDTESAPVAALTLPKKLNGVQDVIVLDSAQIGPDVVPNAPNTTITVDRTDDPSGAALTAASACTGAGNDCSLRGAMAFANNGANNNTTISLPANTYILSINGASANGCSDNATGDLSANQTMSIVGAGAATTIIRQTGTGLANDGDRIMCMNENFLENLIYNFSAVTFSGGRDGASGGGATTLGGGAIIGGERGNALTLTNVTFVNNWTTGPGLGGGGLQITGGDLTITNCTFGGSSGPGLYTDRTSLVNANTTGTSGGGVAYTPSSPAHTGGTGILTVTGTTFTRNVANSICCGGGGADLLIFAFGSPGGIGSGSASFGTSTFTNNQAPTANGGAFITESLPTTVATTSFTNNSSGNRGGAIYLGGGNLLLDGTAPSITFSGNTAVNGGTSVSTSAPVNVSGTNTTIGGSIEVNQNGTWTNNAGSTLSPTNVDVPGGTLNMNNSTMNVSGNLTIGPGGTVGGTFNGNTGIVNIQGNFSFSSAGTPAGTFNAGTGTFNFNGNGAQTITGVVNFNNLTVNKAAGTLTLQNNIGIVNALTVTAGTFDLSSFTSNRTAAGGTLTVSNGATLKLGGTSGGQTGSNFPTNFTTFTFGPSSTIDYSAAGSQTIFATPTYGNLNTSGSGTKTAGNALTIAGTLTIGTGTVLAGGTFTHNVAGNWANNVGNAGYTSSGAGIVNFNGGGAQSLTGQTTFTNVTVNKGGGSTLTLNSPITLTGNMLLTAGNLAAGSNAIGIGGNWTNNSGASAFSGTNTTTFTGGTSNTIGGSASTAFGSLIVNKPGGTLSLLTNITIAGDLTVTAGTFDLSTFTANRTVAGGTLAVSNGAFLTIGGTNALPSNFNSNTFGATSTTNFNGTNQNVGGITYGHLNLSGAGTKTLLGTATIAGNLTIASGTTFDANSQNINIAGNWTNNGGTFTPGSGTVTFTGSSSAINGTATTQTFNNLTANKTAGQILSIGGSTTTLNVGGNLLVSTGTFSQLASALNVTGNLTVSSGATFTKSNTSQPLTFNRTTVGGQSWTDNNGGTQDFGVVIIGGTSNVVSSGSTVRATTLTVNSGNTFFLNGNNFSFSAAAAVANNGVVRLRGPETLTNVNNLDVDSGVVEYIGNNTVGPFTIKDFGAGTDYFNLTIVDVNATEGTYNVGSNLTVANNLTITSGTLAGGSSVISVGGNWANSDTFTAGTSTVVLNGNNNTQTISGNTSFNNLTINHTGTGNVTASGSTLAVTALMRVQGGTFITSSTFNNVQIDATTTLQSDGNTINVTGNWTNNGTFTHGSGTVVFNGAGAQTLSGSSTTLFNNLTLSNTAAPVAFNSNQSADGTLAVNANAVLSPAAATVIGGAGTLNGAGTVQVTRTAATPDFLSQYTIANKTLSGLTVDYTSTGAQTVNSLNYNNLTISGARTTNNVTLASGTVGVSNVFAPTATFTSGTYANTGNTVDFNGAVSQTIPAINYFNLTSSSTGARTLATPGIVQIAGTFTPGTNSYTIAGSTVEYNGSGVAQNLPSAFTTYNNLNLNNAAGTVGFAGLTVQGLINVKAGTFTSSSTYNNVLIDSGSTLAASPASTISVAGNWTNNGSFTPNDGVVIFNGVALQNIAGTTSTGFNSLTINNSAGVLLGIDATVNGVLNLAVGDLNTSTFTLNMPAAASSTGITDVVGNVKRTGFVSGGGALSFGNPFNSISINSGTVPTDINVNLVKAAPATFTTAVQRTYTITPNGGSGISATVRLHYLDSELNSNVEGQLDLWRDGGSGFVDEGQTSRDGTDNWVEKSGVTAFSPWTLATHVVPPAPTAVDDNYGSLKGSTLNVPAPGVLANDTGSPTDVTAIAGGPTIAGGTVTLNTDGSFSYNPPTSTFTGSDSFDYTVNNASGSDTGTVNITVVEAFFINEVLFDPPGTDAPNEYIELRGPASATIPPGVYLVAIEGDSADNPGDVQTIINLSGLSFGSNGFLVLLQNGNTYTTAAGATVITSTTTGFGGLPGSIWSADSSATDLEDASETFILIQTGTAPTLTDDIDDNNDGTGNGTVFTGWTIIDSIGALNDGANVMGYGAYNYRKTGGSGTSSGTQTTINFLPTYVGRNGDSIGATATDWVTTGGLAGSAPNFSLNATDTEPIAFANQALNHIGSTNFDIVAPTVVSIVRANPNPTNATSVDFTVTFSESVTGVDTTDFTLTATSSALGTVSSVSGSGSTRTVTVNTISGNGTIRLDLTDDNSIKDLANNPLGGAGTQNFTTGEAYTIDNTAPTVDITDVSPDPRSTDVSSISIVFSEAITGFDLADLTLTRNGGPNLLTGSQTLTTPDNITFTLGNLSSITNVDGTYLLTLTAAGSSIRDAATNALAGNATDTWARDGDAPTVDITDVSPDPRNSAVSTITIVFSEAISGFDLADLSLTRDGGANLLTGSQTLTGGNITFTLGNLAGITGTDGTYLLTLTASGSSIVDGGGNPLAGNATDSWVMDATGPSVTINQASGQADATSTSPINFTVVFTEPVTNFATGDVTVGGTALPTTGTVTELAPNNGTTYNVAVSGMTASGTVTATIAAGVASDALLNPNAASTSTDNQVTFNLILNNAPVLDNTGTMTLTAIDEDPASNNGTLVSAIIASAGGDRITDVDAGAVEGIAVTAVNNSGGAWEFSTNNGGSWTAFGAPNATSSRLLASNANTRIRFVPNTNFNGVIDPGITFRAWDQFTGSNGGTADTSTNGGQTAFSTATETASITVNAVNDAPVNNVPAGQNVNENATLTFSSGNGNQISISDVDAGAGLLQVTLTATNGTFSLNGTTGLGFTVGDGTADATMTFTGNITDINNALNGLVFTPTPSFSGAASLQIVTNDQGNTGSGGAQSDNDTVSITVNGVNDAPVNTVPGPQSTAENTALVFSSGGGNAISVADGDAGSNPVRVTLNATNGTVTLNGIAGLSFSVGTGTANATMTFTGTLTSINTALNGLTFQPAAGFSGAASLQIITNDQGNTGSGGALSDTDTVNITVNDGGTIQFSSATYSVAENAGPAVITLTRTGGTAGTATVLFQTSNGTADSADYTTVSQTVTFLNGETSKTVNVPITNDPDNEPDQTVNLAISTPGGSGALGAPAAAVLTITNDDAVSFNFSSATYSIAETGLHIDITVNRVGDPTTAVQVNFATSDTFGLLACNTVNGAASQRCDYNPSAGTLKFTAGQMSKTFRVFVNDDTLAEGSEVLTLTLSNPVGGSLGATNTATLTITDHVVPPGTANPIDDPSFFIRMLYVDFLHREPDTIGFANWLATINGCPNGGFGLNNPTCDRVHVAKSFFQSEEFGTRGYFVYRFFDAGLGRRPLYAEFNPSAQQIGDSLSPAESEAAKVDFINAFVATTEFQTLYAGLLVPAQANAFVTKFEQTSGVAIPEPTRSQLVSNMAAGTKTPAETLRGAIETNAVFNAYYNRGFVSMLYFGYLHRDPDTVGFTNWLNTLNTTSDFRALTFGFIYSSEYRRRFGNP